MYVYIYQVYSAMNEKKHHTNISYHSIGYKMLFFLMPKRLHIDEMENIRFTMDGSSTEPIRNIVIIVKTRIFHWIYLICTRSSFNISCCAMSKVYKANERRIESWSDGSMSILDEHNIPEEKYVY